MNPALAQSVANPDVLPRSAISPYRAYNPYVNDIPELIDLEEMYEKERQTDKNSNEDYECLNHQIRISSLNKIDDDTFEFTKLNVNRDHADRRIIVTVTFEDEKYEALLDTGATDTCIRHDIALKHGIKVNPVEGVIALADESQTIPRIGQTENIELQYGTRIVSAPMEVINQSYPFIIGMDLFHQFGFSISGFVNPGDDAMLLSEPEEDTKPSLIPSEQPPEEKTKAFQTAKQKFLERIAEYLKQNAEIPKTSFCPVPEMK
ncbi:hypothetical protein BGZ54_004724, partial [Gamsiella multidivaricata]